MDSSTCYQHLREWSGNQLPETKDPSLRAQSLAKFIAYLRLQERPLEDPGHEALRVITLDYLKQHPEQEPLESREDLRIGQTLENLISHELDQLIKEQENGPWTSCQITCSKD